MIVKYLPYVLSAITLYTMFLAGGKKRYTWIVGLVNQALWVLWIIKAKAWGLVPMNIGLWVVYVRNHLAWSEKKKTPLQDKHAEGLEKLLNGDRWCDKHPWSGYWDISKGGCVDCFNELKPESVPGRVPQDLPRRQEEGESEAIDVVREIAPAQQLVDTCYGLAKQQRLLSVTPLFQSAQPTRSTQTAKPQEIPAKQTSRHKTATQQDKYAGKRTVLYRAPKDVDGAHERRTGSAIWAGSSGKGIWARALEHLMPTPFDVLRELDAQDNQTSDPPRP